MEQGRPEGHPFACFTFDEIQQNLRLRYAVYIKPVSVSGDAFRSLEITPRDRNLQVWAWHSFRPD